MSPLTSVLPTLVASACVLVAIPLFKVFAADAPTSPGPRKAKRKTHVPECPESARREYLKSDRAIVAKLKASRDRDKALWDTQFSTISFGISNNLPDWHIAKLWLHNRRHFDHMDLWRGRGIKPMAERGN